MRTLAWVTLTLALLLPGCNRAAQQQAQPSEAVTTAAPTPGVTDAPASEAEPTSAATTAAPQTQAPEPGGADVVEAWYVRGGNRGPWVEPELRPLAAPTVGVARAAFTEVITGEPFSPGLSTMAPTGTKVLGVNRKDDLLILDVSEEIRSVGTGSAGEIAFAEQLAHTAAQFPGVRGVRLLVEGEQITDLWGHLDWSSAKEPDQFAISPVIISKPEHGASVPAGGVTFNGTANTFEATVELRLVNPAGDVVEKTFTTATCGSGCRGDWTHSFAKVNTPGRWKLIAAESDPSGGEGGGPFTTARVFTVQ